MDLRVPLRARYEIQAPGNLVRRQQVDGALQMIYDDATVVSLTAEADGLTRVAVSGDRSIGLDNATGAIIVSARPTRRRSLNETVDATAM